MALLQNIPPNSDYIVIFKSGWCGHMTIKSFPAFKESQGQWVIKVVLSFRDLYPHSLECILSVIWSISTSLAFDPIFGAKAGGGARI